MSPLHIVYALLVVTVWGANFVASKFALEHFPPVFSTFIRFVALALLLLPVVPKPNKRQLKYLVLLSITGVAHFTLPQASLAVGLDIATCAILNQLCVPFSCLIGVFFYNDRIGKWRMLGLLLAFAGIILVLGSPHIGSSWLGSFYAVLSALFFSIYSAMMKSHPDVSPMQVLAYVCLLGMPQLLLLSFLVESPSVTLITTAPLYSWLGIIFTVLISSIVGHGLWNYLVSKHPMSLVAPFSLLVPIAGVAFGQIFYRETLTLELLLGGMITLIGVGIIVIRRPRILEKGEGI